MMNKEKLQFFINLLKNVQKKTSRTLDLGLIIKEKNSHIKENEIFNEIKELVDIERIVYEKPVNDEDIIRKIINTFRQNKWIFFEIKKDINSPLLNQLKHLSNSNSLQLIDFDNQDVFRMEMPDNSRIIAFAERDFIDNGISYHHFYALFGPTLSIK